MNKEMMRSLMRALGGRMKSVIAQFARREASRLMREVRESVKERLGPAQPSTRQSLEPPPPKPVEAPVAAPEASAPVLPSPTQPEAPAKRPEGTVATEAQTAPGKRAAAKTALGTGDTVATVDINSASRAELVMLPGIGPSRADAILNGRPYKDPAELVRKRVIPAALFTSLRERLRAD